MKKFKMIFAALCCMFVSVSAFAASASAAAPEVIESKKSDIRKYTLKNGIPVYFVQNNENAIDAVSIVVKGGRTYLKPEQSGLENALFTTMARESKKYSYEKRQQISYEKNSTIFSNSIDNASMLTLECIIYYMEELLPILTDSFMNPAFTKPVYETMMTEYSQVIQQEQNDPWSLLQKTFDDIAYKGHPYEASCTPTEESIDNITIDEMKKWHKSVLDSRRIMVVAVSSVKADKLIEKLNSTIGKIKPLKTVLPVVQIDEIKLSGEPVVLTNAAATGSGYAGRIIATPSYKSDDLYAAKLAAEIYSTTAFNLIRTKYGDCYSVGSYARTSAAAFGGEYLYMISNMTNFARDFAEARSIMAAGKYVEKLNDDGTYEFSTIADVLPGTKNTFINSTYSASTRTAGRMSQYISGLVDFDDITISEKIKDKIDAVTADDVLRAFKKYWVEQEGRWIAVVGPESESVISFEE